MLVDRANTSVSLRTRVRQLIAREIRLKEQSNLDTREQTPEIAIVVGHDAHYVEINNFNAVNVLKTVCVGVKNIGNTHLSNCKLHFEASKGGGDSAPEKWLREGPFSLDEGEEKYLSLAVYSEQPNPDTKPDKWIKLSAPPSGNFWQPPMLSAILGDTVTLVASSAESRPCKIDCRSG